MFSGLMSRYTTPLEWRKAIARQSCQSSRRTVSRGSRFPGEDSKTSRTFLGTNFMTMKSLGPM